MVSKHYQKQQTPEEYNDISDARPHKKGMQCARRCQQQKYQQIFIKQEVLVEHHARGHDEQCGKREGDARTDSADKHQPVEQAANGRSEQNVNGVEGSAIAHRKELQHYPSVEIESGRLAVEIVEALEQPMPQQLRVDELEKCRERPRVE